MAADARHGAKRLIRFAPLSYALAAVVLGVVLQASVSLGVAPKAYTENAEVPLSSAESAVPDKTEAIGSNPIGGLPQEPSRLDLYLPTNVVLPLPPAPVATVAAVQYQAPVQGGQLTEAEAISVLEAAGWPTELIPQALAVFCGIGNQSGFPRGESGCSPGAVGDSGRSLGFAQLNGATWAPYCGITQEMLMDVLANARCAWQVYNYDLSRGQAPWTQWTVKP